MDGSCYKKLRKHNQTDIRMRKKINYKSYPNSNTDKKNACIDRDYVFLNIIGTGNFANVFKAKNKHTNKTVCIKRTKTTNGLTVEALVLKFLGTHPNIVDFIGYDFNDEYNYVVLEYIKNGTLLEKTREKQKYKEPQARFIFGELIDAVGFLHDSGIIHRDLKLENIMVKNEIIPLKTMSEFDLELESQKGYIENDNLIIEHPILIDFGFARFWKDDENIETFCGSPHYVAPEMLKQIPYPGPNVDIWSVGVILYAMTHGYMPFDSLKEDFEEQKREIFLKITHYYPRYSTNISKTLKRLLQNMFEMNIKKRCTIEQIKHSEWCKGVGIIAKKHVKRSSTQEIIVDHYKTTKCPDIDSDTDDAPGKIKDESKERIEKSFLNRFLNS